MGAVEGVGSRRIEMVEGSGYYLRDTPITYYIERVRSGRCFSHAKINHGFWERAIRIRNRGYDATPEGRCAADASTLGLPAMLETGFWDEFVEQLAGWPADDPDLSLAVSAYAYSGSLIWGGQAPNPNEVASVIRDMLPAGYEPENALVWKDAVVDGSIRELFDALGPIHKVVVGPPPLCRALSHLPGVPAIHYSIHPTDARREREKIFQELHALHRRFNGEPVAYLFQAATLAVWLIRKLHRRLPGAFLIDLGRALDIFAPELHDEQHWIWHSRAEISANWGITYPRYDRARRAAPTAVAGLLAEAAPAQSPTPPPVPFTPEKWIDPAEATPLLRAGARSASGGPVVQALEAAIHSYLGLPADRAVVACGSGTTALHDLVRLREQAHGRRLRWVVSAFAPAALRAGPLAEAQVVDCDATGLLDLAAVKRLGGWAFDGVVVTNVFGLAKGMSEAAAWCRQNGKELVFDSTAAFDHGCREAAGYPAEAVSLDHSHPWGHGAGGFAILDRRAEADLRSLLRGLEGGLSGPGGDLASALLLRRLERFALEEDQYRLQYHRLVRVGGWLGLKPLDGHGNVAWPRATPGSFPLVVAPGRRAPDGLLDGPFVTLQKEHRPLGDLPVARSIYERIVNVPCHPGLARVKHDDLVAVLRRFTEAPPASEAPEVPLPPPRWAMLRLWRRLWRSA